MLCYTEVCLSHLEVPDERAICIYISGCQNNCKNCHYPLLKRRYYGDLLSLNYENILDLYINQGTCVCFMGEGNGGKNEKEELVKYSSMAHERGLKTCLYSGRDINIESWMNCFDYIKLGSYQEHLGGLESQTTNQKMYKKQDNKYLDITSLFWE